MKLYSTLFTFLIFTLVSCAHHANIERKVASSIDPSSCNSLVKNIISPDFNTRFSQVDNYLDEYMQGLTQAQPYLDFKKMVQWFTGDDIVKSSEELKLMLQKSKRFELSEVDGELRIDYAKYTVKKAYKPRRANVFDLLDENMQALTTQQNPYLDFNKMVHWFGQDGLIKGPSEFRRMIENSHQFRVLEVDGVLKIDFKN